MKSYKSNKNLKSGTPCGLPKGRPTELYPEEVQKFIRENCDGTSPEEMVKLLHAAFGREYQESQIRGYYKNNKLKSGIDKRFQPGHESHNKGKKGLKIPGSEKGWFRKGEDPWNTVEIGTICKKDGGYLWKKIDNKGHCLTDRRMYCSQRHSKGSAEAVRSTATEHTSSGTAQWSTKRTIRST